MLTIYAGVDGGNDSSKIVTNLGDELLLPNVVRVQTRERTKIMNEGIPEEELDVVIQSPSLSNGEVHVLVGQLAIKDDNNKEMPKLSNKATDDQSLIVILTGLAYLAAKNSNEDHVEVTYRIGTGLPVADVKEYRDAFRERLQQTHEVTFKSTPGWENRKVTLYIEFVDVSVEGGAALLNLTMDMSLPDELAVPVDFEDDEYYYGGGDLGALSLDLPVIRVVKRGDDVPVFMLDEEATRGEGFGVATYLDRIIDDIWTKHHVRIPSRQALARILKRGRQKWVVPFRATSVPVHDIVDLHLKDLATRTFEAIRELWDQTPLRRMYMIGGGPVLIKPYLEELNATEHFPLIWIPKSEWRTALGYLDNVIPFDEE